MCHLQKLCVPLCVVKSPRLASNNGANLTRTNHAQSLRERSIYVVENILSSYKGEKTEFRLQQERDLHLGKEQIKRKRGGEEWAIIAFRFLKDNNFHHNFQGKVKNQPQKQSRREWLALNGGANQT